MGISTIPMICLEKPTGSPLSLYLGLGLASYIDLEKILIGCSAD